MIQASAASTLHAPPRLVSISELVRRLGVTPRALRHYEDLGLIRPVRTARNVRAYDRETVETVETIVALRAVDLPLTVISDVLTSASLPELRANKSRVALLQARAMRQAQIDRIDDLLKTMAAA
jgi:DNA-binding transcriptional MerR regulator